MGLPSRTVARICRKDIRKSTHHRVVSTASTRRTNLSKLAEKIDITECRVDLIDVSARYVDLADYIRHIRSIGRLHRHDPGTGGKNASMRAAQTREPAVERPLTDPQRAREALPVAAMTPQRAA
jgi:hypothetical protein